MKTSVKLFPVLLGAVILLGVPPVLLLTEYSPEPPPIPVAKPADPLRTLVAEQSTLELIYRDWQKGYLAAGGDRNVAVSLGWTRGLSTEPSKGRGRVVLG